MNRHLIVPAGFLLIAFMGILSGFSDPRTPAVAERRGPANSNSVLFDQELWVGGVQMGAGNIERWCETIRSIGMNTVEITISARQGIWNSDDLTFPKPSSQALHRIRTAKKAGMKVVLVLRTELDNSHPENDFIWHGMIFPESKTDLESWFKRYQEFATMWSEVAGEEGVDMVVLASELNILMQTNPTDRFPPLESYFLNLGWQGAYQKTVLAKSKSLPSSTLEELVMPQYGDFEACLHAEGLKKAQWANVTTFLGETDRLQAINRRRLTLKDHWTNMIQKVREVFDGKLTIAANFDSYKELGFWKELDCIGINAYFPLRSLGEKDESQMFVTWCKALSEINQYRKQSGIDDRPVFFTELGYTEYAGSTMRPWEGKGFSLIQENGMDSLIVWGHQQKDLFERRMAVRALVKAILLMDFPLQGILYWKFAEGKFDVKEDPFALTIRPADPGYIQRVLAGLIH